MNIFTTKWFKDSNGPKLFNANLSRIQIHESSILELNQFPKAVKLKFNQPGLYVLFGYTNGKKTIYVGESQKISDWFSDKVIDPDDYFAERVAIITSNDENNKFKKPELRYLESKLIHKLSNSYIVINSDIEDTNKPSAAKSLVLNEELKHIEIGLRSLGFLIEDTFTPVIPNDDKSIKKAHDIFMRIPNTRTNVTALLHDDFSVTMKEGTIHSSSSMTTLSNKIIISKILDELRNNPSIDIEGSPEGYTIEYLNDVRFETLTSVTNLVAGTPQNVFYTWKLLSTGESISTLKLDNPFIKEKPEPKRKK